MNSPIPRTFDAWRHCIEHDCGIPLTPAFIEARLSILQDPSNAERQRFATLYGAAHLEHIITWFSAALAQTQAHA